MTTSDHYLEPVLSMLNIRKNWLANQTNPETDIEGSLAWVGRHTGSDSLHALGKYRQCSKRQDWDADLLQHGDSYMKYILTGNEGLVIDQLSDLADFFDSNKAALTSEIRFTDRIFELQKKYLNANFESQSNVGGGDIEKLYSMITGDPGDRFNPYWK